MIPAHNRAGLVGRAIDSALNQTLAPHEVIVVDDDSTDSTPEALGEFGEAIRTVRTERNVERGAARNLGARRARGEFVAFLDSDDEWAPEKLWAQTPAMRESLPSVTGVTWIDAGGRPARQSYVPPAGAWDLLPVRNPYLGSPSSLTLPRELFHQLGGFPERLDVQGAEDWLFLLRLRAAGGRLAVVDRPLVRYRRHGGNSIGDPRRVAASQWAALAWLEAEGMLTGETAARARAASATTIARGFAWHGEPAEAAGWTRTAIRHSSAPGAMRNGLLVAASGAWGALKRLSKVTRTG